MVTTARIYVPPKNAMRSIAQPKSWVLDFEQASPKAVGIVQAYADNFAYNARQPWTH